MKIEKRGTMPNGDNIQIESWREDYPNLSEPFTVAAYPVSRYTLAGDFAPKAGRKFRCDFTFPTIEAAAAVFDALTAGTAQLADYAEYMYNPKHKPCITA